MSIKPNFKEKTAISLSVETMFVEEQLKRQKIFILILVVHKVLLSLQGNLENFKAQFSNKKTN